MKKKSLLLVLVLCVLFLSACETKKTQVHVFIAASLSESMEKVKEDFEKENPNIEVIYVADSSGTLKKQIEEGAICDLFFSAASDKVTQLEEKGLAIPDSKIDMLSNKLVLIKAMGEPTEVTGFATITNAKNIALAGEDVPAGSYAREVFSSLGIMENIMQMEINECMNVTAVLTSVAEKSNEVGIVYLTDAKSMEDQVEVIEAADESLFQTPILYPVVKIENKKAGKKETKAADEFYQYLQKEESLKIFKEYGFETQVN